MSTKLGRTKYKIIKVAQAVFAQMSVYKATMNDIADAAKISRRTLYTHFKSKEDLYQEVVAEQIKNVNAKLQKVANSALPPDRKLKLYILERFNVIDNLIRENKNIRYEYIFNPVYIQKVRKDIDAKELQIITDIITKGKEQNIFKVTDPTTFAKTLLIMFKGLEQPFIKLNKSKRNYHTLHEYVDLMFYGIINNNKS
ncbi:MAG: TetR/AcrR family transcriptional regulator [Marinifilaceae bacterium]